MSSDTATPVERVVAAVTEWPGATTAPHPYDGLEFHVDDHEFGHVHHGWKSVHINYPRRIRDALIDAGRVSEHPYFTNTGWTERDLATPDDVADARWLLRVSYLYRALTRRQTDAGRAILEQVDVTAELDELGVDGEVRAVFEDVLEAAEA